MLLGVSSTSRMAMARASASSRSSRASIKLTPCSAASSALASVLPRKAIHSPVNSARTQSLRYKFAAKGEVWRSLAEAYNIFAAHFENAEEAAKGCLRMRERGLALLFGTTRDQRPGMRR